MCIHYLIYDDTFQNVYLIPNCNGSKEDKTQIKAVSMDIWGAYKSVTEEVFPNAQVVVDKFHFLPILLSEQLLQHQPRFLINS